MTEPTPAGAEPTPRSDSMNRAPLVLLYLNVLVIATCGLVYELLAGTLASYLLGDTVTQFSLVIGLYLSAMGVGAWLSGFVTRGVARCFIEVELGVALLGGLSAPLLFLVFAWDGVFQPTLYGLVGAIGTLVGLELPLLMRLLREQLDFNDLVSRVLTFDYLGALAASLLFPMFLVPRLGLVRTSLLCGLVNAAVALWGTYLLRPLLSKRGLAGLRGRACLVLGLLAIALIKADTLTKLAEEGTLEAEVVHAESTPYQRIVLTRSERGFQLFLNGHLQFNSVDEYRYHEALVHPGLSTLPGARRVLVLGGGDGLAVREILKYPQIESVTLVDLDPAMTQLFSTAPPLRALNGDALASPKVRVVNADALKWLENSDELFDFVVVDFPDPSNFAIGKLYSAAFYRLLEKHLTAGALAVIQSTSPLYARQSFWCVVTTLESVGLVVTPYHALVPSFGEWGFVLAGRRAYQPPAAYPVATRFLSPEITPTLFQFPKDMARVDAEVNRLNNQVLVRYFENEWRQVIR